MTATSEQVVITEPGVYDLDDAIYHADPVPAGSLSKSGATKLLDCPAKFDHDRNHSAPPRKSFDLGHAAHKLVLGAGPELREIPEDYLAKNGAVSTTDAREFIKQARADGAVPLKPAEYQQVQEMAAALRAHPIASALLDPTSGTPEQSLFWVDPDTGVWLRARLDWLPHKVPGRRTIVPDYKTAVSADPWQFRKTAADYGYHMQHAMYLDAVDALDLASPAPAFVFVVQEKTAPYVVTVVELDTEAESLGRRQIRKAVALFAECQRTGRWPGYTDEVALVSLPDWYQHRIEESL